MQHLKQKFRLTSQHRHMQELATWPVEMHNPGHKEKIQFFKVREMLKTFNECV